ncbi:MAG: autotransporter outer membrane beta-barrel domain-containing protein [Verrucomicrobiota bacterium]
MKPKFRSILHKTLPALTIIPAMTQMVHANGFATLPGLSPSQASVGAAIDSSINSDNVTVQEFIAALNNSDLATVQQALDAPARILSYGQALVTSNYLLHRTTQEHLAQVRGATTTTTVAASGGKGGMATTETTSIGRGNAWGGYSYDWLDSNSDHSNNSASGDISSFTVGVDWRLAPNLLMGVVLDGTTGSNQDAFKGAVYGTWGESMGIYSDFLAGYGTHNLDSSDSFFGTNSPDANQFQALWTFGYTMGDREVKHGPFVGLEYQNVNVDRFNPGLLPVTLDSGDLDSLRGLIGYRVNASYGRFSPYASVAYAHEFQDDNIDGSGTFDGNPFTVSGDSLGSAILLSAGTNYAFTDKLAMNIGYRGELSVESNGVDSNGGTIGLNYAF